MSSYPYTAFYDLDHTILDGNSATHLVQEARKRGVMSERQYRHAVWLSILYKLDMGDPTRMIKRMLTWLKGVEEADITALAQEIFDHIIKETIRPEILETIREHRAQKAKVVLLSSATTPICQPVTLYLELDEMICTRLESESGILTGHTHGKLVYGPEKKVRMLAYCHENNYDPREAWYYGDSHTDKYVMEAVGFPVAVSPDKKLLRIANRNNWPILL
ncbi:MAG: HAD-IB family hydrolase [Bacteroidales bacterium]|nr:HAD-IB family hydrolase [Bacteroidales bacterium]